MQIYNLCQNQGWEKTVFFYKKTIHLFFFVFLKKNVFGFFWKEKIFSSFLRKTEKKTLWIVFIDSCNITIFRITQQ